MLLPLIIVNQFNALTATMLVAFNYILAILNDRITCHFVIKVMYGIWKPLCVRVCDYKEVDMFMYECIVPRKDFQINHRDR